MSHHTSKTLMKTDYSLLTSRRIFAPILASIFFLNFLANFNLEVRAQEENHVYPSFEGVIASADARDLQTFGKVGNSFDTEFKRFQKELLNIFCGPKSSNLQKCSAAYYLGETRSPEALEALAASITLELDFTHYKMDA